MSVSVSAFQVVIRTVFFLFSDSILRPRISQLSLFSEHIDLSSAQDQSYK